MRQKLTTTIALSLLLGIFLVEPILAGSGGSAYSLFGIGDLRYPVGVRAAGMGYAGLGIPGPSYINSLAPGTWSLIDRVRFEAALAVEGFNSTDGTRSRFLSRGDLAGAIFSLPISRSNGIVFVGGFVPYSAFNYDTYNSSSYTSASDTMRYSVHHVGTGGITRGFAGLSYAPSPELALGFSFNYLFGSLTDEQAQIPLGAEYYGGTAYTSTTGNGATLTFGALWRGFDVISPDLKPLSIGLAVTTRGTLRSLSQRDYKYSPNLVTSQRDTTPETSSVISVPIAWGIGLSYQVSQRFVVAADYYTQPWATAEINGESPPSLRNSHRFGAGAELAPSRELYSGFFARLAYRLGAFYNATYVQANGTPINEYGVTAGLSIPFSGDSRLNFHGEYAHRGTTENGLIADRIIRFSVSLNISASWFQQFSDE